MKHPIQKTKVDDAGVLRFVQNDVVRLMLKILEVKGIDLNDLHVAGRGISSEDWDQFNQLIGYSVANAPIDEAICCTALRVHRDGDSIEEARALEAETTLAEVRKLLAGGVAELYGRCVEDIYEAQQQGEG